MSSQEANNPSGAPHEQSLPGSFPSPPPTPTISSHQSLTQAVYERRAEYTRSRRIRVKVGSWNVAALSGTEKDIGGWFIEGKGVSEAFSGLKVSVEDDPGKDDDGRSAQKVAVESVEQQEARAEKESSTIPKNDPGSLPGGDDIGLYVLGLQEIVDVNSATEAFRPYVDPAPSNRWKASVSESLPSGYELIAEQQLIGLLLLIYASPSVAHSVTSVSVTSVGTGLLGYLGNKGAVTARIILGETTRMVFVNCHLAAGVEKGSLDKRNSDANHITIRTKFAPIQHPGGVIEDYGEGIGDEEFAFWFGDLNYRLNTLAGEDVRRLLMLHTRNEYDIRQKPLRKIANELADGGVQLEAPSKFDIGWEDSDTESQTSRSVVTQSSVTTLPSGDGVDPASDPASLQTTLSSLLPHDQLHEQMRLRKAFHDGWREGPINFLPTYKYDVGSVGVFDTSEKKRGPSWCDRILYRTRRDRLEYLKHVREEEEARRRDAEMKARGLDKSTDDEVLYDYDPDTDGVDDGYEENVNVGDDPDLVITKAGYEDRIRLDYYTSHQRVLSSDHKPLNAVFTLDYDAVDPNLKAQIHQEVARELDKAENEGRPTVTIVIDRHSEHDESSDESISFGDIRYNHPKLRSLTVANTGRVPATFGFVERHTGDKFPPWLTVRFDRPSDNLNPNSNSLHEYTLEPGDALNVELTVRIKDIDQVRSLNEGRLNIEDVLVLRVNNGRDHFLPVRGSWLQSSFGRSLDKLIRIPEGGVRRLQHQQPDRSGYASREEPVKWSAPREIFRLTEAIEELVERATAERGMKHEKDIQPWDKIGWPFTKESWTSTIKAREGLVTNLRDALDLGEPFMYPEETDTVQRVEALAETLLTFIDSLEDGVINERLWEELSKGLDEREKSKKPMSGEEMRSWVLDKLSASPAHSVTFTFLAFMLARVVNEIAPLPSLPPTPSTPKSPDALLGRPRGFSQDPAIARRQQIDRKFAEIFATVTIKAPSPTKAKEMKVEQDKRCRVIEVFLRSRWEESL
ncbi:hypothetical protein MMC30_005368 [Trapelia coarctata]|nr:hypothetical protein [Trapelia coarctata]